MKYQIKIFYGEKDINNILEELILEELNNGNCNFDNFDVLSKRTKKSLQEGGNNCLG